MLEHPGLLYVAATLLPLTSFVLLLLAGGLRAALRRQGGFGATVHELLGGDNPKWPAYVATGAIALAFVCALLGCIEFSRSHSEQEAGPAHEHHEHAEGMPAEEAQHSHDEYAEHQWEDRVEWAVLSLPPAGGPGRVLQVGYRIDHLSVVMFLMVTFIASLIHLFSIGYMADEANAIVEDHDVHGEGGGHLRRRGRFGRFFMFLSLFCFSMLNLILADNLFQVFVSWELVGICSYLLIGFYFERQSASNAANKAFITNRVGDAGFIIGLLILWTYVGTLNFEDLFQQVRGPLRDTHGPAARAGELVRAEPVTTSKGLPAVKVTPRDTGSEVVLFPAVQIVDENKSGHFHAVDTGSTVRIKSERGPTDYGAMPYWLLVVAGLGIVLGCVGKSAQFPLQVWLPDAMEGPTPVSALIHAATMVAAGVYLVGRCYPLFTPEARLVIAYVGAITLFVAATIAIVMTDIKKVLAYSTVSQLGYMMLALGVGGWVAGLFHLVTHAFFKALLFLCSGSVIYGCHHQQDMLKMGGLYPKMKITALTMLVGVLTIAGIPLFSGWYSKDSILAHAFGFMVVHREHFLLFLLPLLTAGMTTFYMFRMWFMTFTGEPRDHHVYDHAHESPWQMTVPLIVLAFFSICVAWGWPIWDAESSHLEHQLHHSQHVAVMADFGVIPGEEIWPGGEPRWQGQETERVWMHAGHGLAGAIALGIVLLAIAFSAALYYYRVLDPAEAKEQFAGVHRFLTHKWYFDELYSELLVRPALAVAVWFKNFDLKAIDGTINATARGTVGLAKWDGRFDNGIVDGLVNLTGKVIYAVGGWLRTWQTGYLRTYVLFLVLAVIGLFVILSYFVAMAAAR